MQSSPQDSSSLRAKFNPLVRPYLVLYVAAMMTMTIVFIPLVIIWLCGLGQWWARHYYDLLECELGDTALRFRKGIFFQVEKTIPLENIQDVTFVEGPLLKRFHLSILKFETAGQSAGQAHDMRLVGIIDAHNFRTEILRRRQHLKRVQTQHGTAPAGSQDEMLVTLRAIAARVDEIAAHLRERR